MKHLELARLHGSTWRSLAIQIYNTLSSLQKVPVICVPIFVVYLRALPLLVLEVYLYVPCPSKYPLKKQTRNKIGVLSRNFYPMNSIKTAQRIRVFDRLILTNPWLFLSTFMIRNMSTSLESGHPQKNQPNTCVLFAGFQPFSTLIYFHLFFGNSWARQGRISCI